MRMYYHGGNAVDAGVSAMYAASVSEFSHFGFGGEAPILIRTKAGKEKLAPALSAGNTEKTMAAPVTVIVAHCTEFYDFLPTLFPHADARAWFAGHRRSPTA